MRNSLTESHCYSGGCRGQTWRSTPILGDFLIVAEDNHALVRRTDKDAMMRVSRAASQQGQGRNDGETANVHALLRAMIPKPDCCSQNDTDFQATYVKPPKNIMRKGTEIHWRSSMEFHTQ